MLSWNLSWNGDDLCQSWSELESLEVAVSLEDGGGVSGARWAGTRDSYSCKRDRVCSRAVPVLNMVETFGI